MISRMSAVVVLMLVFGLVGCSREEQSQSSKPPAKAAPDNQQPLTRNEIAALVRTVVAEELAADRERILQERANQLAVAEQEAESARNARINAGADAVLEHDRRSKEQARLLLTPDELNRVETIRKALKVNGFWTMGSDDLQFAAYGDASPLLYEDLAVAVREGKGVSFMSFLSEYFNWNEDQRLEAALDRDHNMNAWAIRSTAITKLKKGEDLPESIIRLWREDPYLRQPIIDYLSERPKP